MNFIKKVSDREFIINLRVKPNSKKQIIHKPDIMDDSLTISICSATKKNKANKELLRFLKKKLKSELESINFISGLKSRNKRILIAFSYPSDENDIKNLLLS